MEKNKINKQTMNNTKAKEKLTNLLNLGIGGLTADTDNKYYKSEEYNFLTNFVYKLLSLELGYKKNEKDTSHLHNCSAVEQLEYLRDTVIVRY